MCYYFVIRQANVKHYKYMGRHSAATLERIEELKEQYGLTDKQARYTAIKVEDPSIPNYTAGKMAGYPVGSVVAHSGNRLKSPRILKATKAELAKKAKMAEEMAMYEANPQQYLKAKFLEHAHDPTIVANQTRALELVGKMDGAFIERIEIDPGRGMRGNLFGDFVKKANVSEEPEAGS